MALSDQQLLDVLNQEKTKSSTGFDFSTAHPVNFDFSTAQPVGQSTIGATSPISTKDVLPLTSQTHGIVPAALPLDILNLVSKAAISTPRAMLQNQQPPSQYFDALRTELRGGRQVQGETGQPSRLDPFMNMVGESLPFLAPSPTKTASAISAVGNEAGNVAAAIPQAIKDLLHKNVGRLLTDPEMEAFAQTVRQAAFGARTAEGITFDTKIARAVAKNPTLPSPAIDVVGYIESLMQEDPTVAAKVQQGMYRSAKKGNTTLSDFLQNRNQAMSATAKDLQNIKLTLQDIPSIARAQTRLPGVPFKPGSFQASVSDADLSLLDAINSTRASLLSSFPETQQAYNQFSSFMNDYRTVLPSLRKGTMERTILEGLKTAEQRQALTRTLPSEMLQQIEKVRTEHQQALATMQKSEDFHKLLKKLGVGAAAAAGGGALAGLGLKTTYGGNRY